MVIPSRTSTIFCHNFFSLCDPPAISEYKIPFPKSKPTDLVSPAVSGKEPLKIVHISDVHIDLSYTVGANTNCTYGICCYVYTPSDAPNVTDSPAGLWGDHKCDTPLNLAESLYAAIEELVPDAAFTLFTGDLVEGREWLTTHFEVVNDIDSAYTHMAGLKKVYATVGNHEASPVNSFPPESDDVPPDSSNQVNIHTLLHNDAFSIPVCMLGGISTLGFLCGKDLRALALL